MEFGSYDTLDISIVLCHVGLIMAYACRLSLLLIVLLSIEWTDV